MATVGLTSHVVVAASVAGSYRLHAGPDVASELVLRPDGKFEYFLMAGSLDEQSHGRWRVRGGLLQLNTIPKPVAPVFAVGRTTSTKRGPLVLHVIVPAGHGIGAVDFALGFDTGEPVTGYTQDYGWSLNAAETRTPRWVVLALPIYNLRSKRFPIDITKGNELTFILTPHDLGTIDFTGMQIDIQPHRLVIHRDGGLMTFEAAATSSQ